MREAAATSPHHTLEHVRDDVEPVQRTRNARGEGARLRDEILDAARALLADDEAATLRAVARRAGVSAPSIYRHFADVDAIMTVVAEQAFDELVAALRDAGDPTATSVERLHAVCGAYLEFAEERPELYRVMFGGVWNAAIALERHPDEEARLRGMGLETFEPLVAALTACVDDGASASDDPQGDAVTLWLGLHGLADQRQAAPLFPWPEGVDRALVRRLARLDAHPSAS